MKPILICLLFFLGLSAYAQHTVVVNPDGTHSVIVNNGNVSTIVNQDGTHSTAIMNGNSSTIVNPDGTHSTAIMNGSNITIVNSDGTHSTVIRSGDNTTIVNPKERKVWQIINSNHKKKSAKKHDNKHTETDD